jgi:hypothetical protein
MSASFPHTVAALAAYDRWEAESTAAILGNPSCTNEDVYAWMAEEERQGRIVGHAFWLDTADINSRDTCEGCVRPGPWLRSLVAKYGPHPTPPARTEGVP